MPVAPRPFVVTSARLLLPLDAALALTVAFAAWAAISTPHLVARLDLQTAHLFLMVFGALVAGGIAVLGVLGARTLRHTRPAWLGAAFALVGALGIPLSALDPRLLDRSPGLLVTTMTLDLATALLLIVAARPPTWIGAWAAAAIAAGGAVLAVGLGALSGLLVPAVVRPPDLFVLAVVATVAWIVAGGYVTWVGWYDQTSATWRIGIGLFIIGLAHTYRIVAERWTATTGLGFTVLQLIGALAVLGGLVRQLRGEVIRLTTQTDDQRSKLQEAADRVSERNHELANGLAGLSGIAFLLDDPAAREDMPALRTAVVSELSRMHALLDGDSGGAHVPGPDDFDVAALAGEIALLHRGRGMDVQIDADGATAARGDRAAVGQVLTNLLVNCERHAPGSPVRIHLRNHDGQVIIDVVDDGPGIPDGADRAITERGVAGPDSGGSGLGLHVSARLMAEQGGSLRVREPAPGHRGFVVRLQLPSAQPSPAQVPPARVPPAQWVPTHDG